MSFLQLIFLLSFTLLLVSSEGDILTRSRRGSAYQRASVITVEWEGTNANISGYTVDYRRERRGRWMKSDVFVPFKGPNYQYRVRIKDLPLGFNYLVRVNVLDASRKVILTTPPIRAYETPNYR